MLATQSTQGKNAAGRPVTVDQQSQASRPPEQNRQPVSDAVSAPQKIFASFRKQAEKIRWILVGEPLFFVDPLCWLNFMIEKYQRKNVPKNLITERHGIRLFSAFIRSWHVHFLSAHFPFPSSLGVAPLIPDRVSDTS
ncbi:hypothetical protein [Acidithiobacillus acidisediminis]|uniref:hypothetical protein n=1 Tax=Acidithiobacillus acidisediminis TaxID=2937799 RepID=UPI00200D1D95|nr:hypothetical protein [Acidithiobacillus sp. S30A2]